MSLLEEYGIKEDERFRRARKESLVIVIYALLTMIWCFSWGFVGLRTPPEEYSYIMGFPAWFFQAFLGGGIVSPLVGMIVAVWIRDCDLEDAK